MMRLRKQTDGGWNHRRLRNHEWERAMQALRNALLILFVVTLALSYAFGIAWNQ